MGIAVQGRGQFGPLFNIFYYRESLTCEVLWVYHPCLRRLEVQSTTQVQVRVFLLLSRAISLHILLHLILIKKIIQFSIQGNPYYLSNEMIETACLRAEHIISVLLCPPIAWPSWTVGIKRLLTGLHSHKLLQLCSFFWSPLVRLNMQLFHAYN